MPDDLLGRPLEETEARLLAVHDELTSLAARELSPAAAAGVRLALAHLSQVVNTLALRT
jgi:hypothetical protein